MAHLANTGKYMHLHGFLNTALLSGFAWKRADGTWWLRQREPELLALPLALGPGVRTPEHREAVDLAGSLTTEGGRLGLLVRWLDRACVSSFPRRLEWTVHGVAPGEPMFPGAYVTRYGREVGPDEIDLSLDVVRTLGTERHLPQDVLDVLRDRDPDTAAWADGTTRVHRLTNFVILAGMVGRRTSRLSHAGNPYYLVDLQTAAPPALPITVRVTRDMPGFQAAYKHLLSFAPFPVTVSGAFLAKVRPSDDGGDPSVTYQVRATGITAAFPEDVGEPRGWVEAWREAGRQHASASLATDESAALGPAA